MSEANFEQVQMDGEFSEKKFWQVMKKVARRIPFLKQILAMYYVWKDETTPLWVKTICIGSLAYFIMPMDAIPDVVPILGYSDDTGVVAAGYAAIRQFVTAFHEEMAEAALDDLLG